MPRGNLLDAVVNDVAVERADSRHAGMNDDLRTFE